MSQTNYKNKIILGKNEAQVVPFNLQAGKEKSLKVVLSKPGAKVEILGSGRLGKNEKYIGNIQIIHKAPQTFSRVKIKAVLVGHSQVDLNGLIRIEHGAKGADGFFAADFLLFDEARAKPMPFLEILDNDVKVGHAATISRVNEEQMFYLESRGLSKRQAEKLIVDGFLKN